MICRSTARFSTALTVAGGLALVGCGGGDSSATVTLGALGADGAAEFDVVMTVDGEEILDTTATEQTEREVEVSGDFSITVEVVNRSETGIVRCGIAELLPQPIAGNGEQSVTCTTRGSVEGDSIQASSQVEPVDRPGTPVELAAVGTVRVPEGYEVRRSVDPGDEDAPVLAAGEEWVVPSLQLLLDAEATGPGGGELAIFRETDPGATDAATVAAYVSDPVRGGGVEVVGEQELGGRSGVLLRWEDAAGAPDQVLFYADVGDEVLVVRAAPGTSLETALADLEALVASVPADAGG